MANYNVLVVGNGGREHELARQFNRSEEVDTVCWTNPNAALQQLDKAVPLFLKSTDVEAIATFARQDRPDFTIIGPEKPLALGLGDLLRAQGLKVFGPSAEAARLETSKIFATQFMERNGIPYPPSWISDDPEQAMKDARNVSLEKSVLKADGLAAGKGVVLPADTEGLTAEEVAEKTVYGMLNGTEFEGAGRNGVVVQERFHGPELSVLVISDGRRFVILPPAQDHKRLKDNDEGPNTGGMGAYAPVPSRIVASKQWVQIEEIAQRSIESMAYEGRPFEGCLYLGLMLAEEKGWDPVVIEYNARFGDPETQVILPLLENAGVDVPDLIRSAAEGSVKDIPLRRNLGNAALTVCLAAQGYPDSPLKGDAISGLDRSYKDVIVHQAGTKRTGEQVFTNGGRVLYITGIGENIDEAAVAAYGVIDSKSVTFNGEQHRSDIGYQARS